jgi:hypothetical protein
MNRLRYFVFIFALGLAPCDLRAQGKAIARIDASKTGAPITKLATSGKLEVSLPAPEL